jgi:hypothetical protein
VPVEAPPRRPDAPDELEAVIKEARRRARRRRLGYAATLVLATLLGGGLYLGFHGSGGSGSGSKGESSPNGGAGAQQPSSHAREASVYPRHCPRRGLDALPLTAGAERSARGIAEARLGSSPEITITARPATHAGTRGTLVSSHCGPKVARRTLVVFTWDHRFDHGLNKSASLAQHASLVSRFDDGYHLWYWEH